MITTPNTNKIWQLYTGKIKSITGTGKCYLGFSSTTPNADGSNFTEPTTDDYERIQMNINEAMTWTDKFGTVADGMVTNSAEVCTPECKTEGGWDEWTHFAIFDCITGGTPLAFDLLTDPDGEADEDGRYPAKTLKVELNHVAVFRAGTLKLSLV